MFEFDVVDAKNITVHISKNNERLDKSLININSTLQTGMDLINVRYIDFTIQCTTAVETSTNSSDQCEVSTKKKKVVNGLALITMNQKKPRKVELKTRKNFHHDLYNDLVSFMQDNGGGTLSSSSNQKDARACIDLLCNALWYMENQHPKINDCATRKGFETIPKM